MPQVSEQSATSAELRQQTSSKSAVVRAGTLLAPEAQRLRPSQVTWEMTRVFSWKTASARPARNRPRDTNRFSTAEAFHLIEQVAAMHVPVLALTGGDPLTRLDLYPIIEFAASRSVRTSLTLLPTPLLEPSVISELKVCGLLRIGLWIHGSTPALHDSYWGVSGLHRRTLTIIGTCHEVQLPVHVNTIVSRANFHDLDGMIELLIRLDIELWNVVFYVPAAPDQAGAVLSAREQEEVFAKLYAAAKRVRFQIKTSEAPQYLCFLLQQRARESRGRLSEADVFASAAKANSDGPRTVFINDRGEVYPSRFLPLSGGDLTQQSLADVCARSPLFASLRETSKLKGKCGRCPARNLCGGSRARAYVMTGDLFAADPCCAFEP
jgi:AdoMet-dependent heme synthase